MKAWTELDALREQERTIAIRKSQLQNTVSALYPLVFPAEQDINSFSLANAIRLIFNGASKPLTARAVRDKLDDMGFDLTKHENVLASIHTAMKRMADTEEIILVPDTDNPQKTFEAGPELKQVESATPTFDAMEEALKALAGESQSK